MPIHVQTPEGNIGTSRIVGDGSVIVLYKTTYPNLCKELFSMEPVIHTPRYLNFTVGKGFLDFLKGVEFYSDGDPCEKTEMPEATDCPNMKPSPFCFLIPEDPIFTRPMSIEEWIKMMTKNPDS